MACACKNKNRANVNNVVVKRTPVRHTPTHRTVGSTKRIIRRQLN